MGFYLPFVMAVGLLLTACTYIGLPAFATAMTVLACLMAGCSASLVGVLYLTNKRQMDYEIAFKRSFLTGVGVVAVSIFVWTALLDLLAGGLTTALVENLWHVSCRMAAVSFAVALISFGSWAALVFSRGKSDSSDRQP